MNVPANLRTLDPNREGGYRCPACGGPMAVIDSRPSPEGIRRRRMCHCGERITTYETSSLSVHQMGSLLAKVRRASTELDDLRSEITDMICRKVTPETEAAE